VELFDRWFAKNILREENLILHNIEIIIIAENKLRFGENAVRMIMATQVLPQGVCAHAQGHQSVLILVGVPSIPKRRSHPAFRFPQTGEPGAA
jgi:hypothetical protein